MLTGAGDFNGDGADEIVVLPSLPGDGPGGEFDGGYAHLIYGCSPKSPLPTHTKAMTTTPTTTSTTVTEKTTMPVTATTTESNSTTPRSYTSSSGEAMINNTTTMTSTTSNDGPAKDLSTSFSWTLVAAVVGCAIVVGVLLTITVRGCLLWWRKHKIALLASKIFHFLFRQSCSRAMTKLSTWCAF